MLADPPKVKDEEELIVEIVLERVVFRPIAFRHLGFFAVADRREVARADAPPLLARHERRRAIM